MDTLVSMKVFRLVVEAGSFARAAGQLGISPAMASKHLAHLERSLGARLLNRTSRHVSPTEAGQVYFEQCCEALDLLDNAEATLQDSHAEPRGQLKVTAPVWCANGRFAGMLACYRERYPRVAIDLRLSNYKVDLAEEGFDLALRATAAQNAPSLIVRPLCEVRFVLTASRDYVDRHGPFESPAQLADHPAVLPAYVKRPEEIPLQGPAGPATLRLPTALKTDDSSLARHSLLAGIGPGYLPEWLIADDLASGALVRLLPQYRPPAVTLYAAYTSRKFMAPKVRTFIDFFSEAFG
ncbi:LysR family transcriptional regulator [Pigmentiphaga sp.]|uniref:LysR family transcriptional regulator n=1 Tax=Pigmentiphaga sp. TaxID=1977564 RepID=UPI00128CAEF5|nr:LysR family transcriptional regulator [Pigmentiphaga sp.]MPS25731.1 LysR family transcriptional regulator [Alcaligenaceae bacterium SAGV5]MPS54451.1 LysR family transcriptional regulator [Alcaligenaceae bacterium SAGV3]MPT58591.1 LysR family transcriptional regulator [Alcaligenaceae bacterium]